MSIEGLDFILNKQEVVPTVSAADLVRQPERVEADYLRHVRTYVPINRAAEGREGALSVTDYEQRVIKAVKSKRAPLGYLTGEYGYGKTSTALHVWQSAQEANLVAVPPFQMLHLADLITAAHGWLRYRLTARNPKLALELDELHQQVTGQNLEEEARAKRVNAETLREWVERGRFILDLQPADFIHFFERATEIVERGGFDGWLMLPDEIQQYIEPAMLRSDEPIAPMFNLVQQIRTREGHLRFGMIWVIPLKELGVIREARDDLIARLRDHPLDLTNVYDSDFAERLWHLLAKEFGFADFSREIVAPDTLEALGEIAAREDLSNGPRTVVNVFRRMVERYKTYGTRAAPYSPIDLVDDMLEGAIQFTGADQIQKVTRRALQNPIVRSGGSRYESAVKLAAAYPTSGVPLRTQQDHGVADVLDDLMRQALGELVIAVGPLDQHGITLFGVQVGVQQTEWLPQAIRDFRRVYGEHHANTRDRAVRTFVHLLKSRVFAKWNLIEERQASFTANHSLIFEGDFASFASRFPKRRVHVRILWEDEETKDADIDGDLALEFKLSIHPELREQPEERRRLAQSAEIDYEAHTAVVPINLVYVRSEGFPLQVQQRLQDVWSPYDLSPLVLMNIYQALEEKRAAQLIPRTEDALIANAFQPELLDTVFRNLFNSEVGSSLGGVAEDHIVEACVERLLDARYGDTYHTVMNASNWRNMLLRYTNAINSLNNPYQKRGEVDVEGTKTEIAGKMSFTNVTLDSFVKTYGDLMNVVRDWRGNEVGAVRFTLHDLEARIMRWLHESPQVERVQIGGKTAEVHTIGLGEVYNRARLLGYQNDEIEELLKLLAVRDMAEAKGYLLREIPSQSVDLDEVGYQFDDLDRELTLLLGGFPNTKQLSAWQEHIGRWRELLQTERDSGTPDPQRVYQLGHNIQVRHRELQQFAQDKQQELLRQVEIMRQSLQPVNPHHVESLQDAIMGSVSFVDQVNAIRRAVLESAHRVKSRVDSLNADFEHAAEELRRPDLTSEGLVRSAEQIAKHQQSLEVAKEQLERFANQYQHFGSWNNLVVQGTGLFNELQQLGAMADAQMTAFQNIAREISGRISSAKARLDVLPDHAIFATRTQFLREETRKIRVEAENAFVDLQNRYSQSLIAGGLYRRDQLERSLTYNVSNPDESYRLLYDRMQSYVRGACDRLIGIMKKQRRDVKNTLGTPLIATLLPNERATLEERGRDILSTLDKTLSELAEVETGAADIAKIKDFPSDGGGTFQEIVETLSRARATAGDMERLIRELIGDGPNVTDTEMLFLKALGELLPQDDLERSVDLLEWRNQPACRNNHDLFWEMVRSLYDKQRIRLSVSHVRR